MQVIHTISDLRAVLAGATRTALVATMGNLHEGHLALVRDAAGRGFPVVVTVFVNRLQFLPHEDFSKYPRTLQRDCALLEGSGADIVFAPSEAEIYPEPQVFKVTPPSDLADILEGEFRPGFFTGVCTVVMKLFECVRPSVTLFGKKDYQQWMIIERMARQFALPLEVVARPTIRADDGLALSSRNGYLDIAQRSQAVALPKALRAIERALRQGATELAQLEQVHRSALTAQGWVPDYVAIRKRSDLLPPSGVELATKVPLVVLAAARIGATRLIDNLEVDL